VTSGKASAAVAVQMTTAMVANSQDAVRVPDFKDSSVDTLGKQTEHSVDLLCKWFIRLRSPIGGLSADSANAAEQMFVALNGAAVVYHDDASATQIAGWTEWVIDLTEFAGVDLTNVNSIAIGVGTKGSPAAGGAGTMYFDDIRLIR
jgi:hypothetical protein